MGFGIKLPTIKQVVANPIKHVTNAYGAMVGGSIAGIPGAKKLGGDLFSTGDGHGVDPGTTPGGGPASGLPPLPAEYAKPTDPLKAPTSSPYFDQARQNTKAEFSTQRSQGNDAINRRFAALGGLNSGSAIKQQAIFQDKVRAQESQALGDINAQEAQKMSDQQFQVDSANRDQGFKDKVFAFDSQSKLKQLDLADKQFQLDRDAQEFNKRLAAMEAGKKPEGIVGSLLNGIF